jgi:uncharacterized protein YegP (UPF0339 family)
MKFAIYINVDDLWYWELRLEDGKPIATCAAGYETRHSALAAVEVLRKSVGRAAIFDLTGNRLKSVE